MLVERYGHLRPGTYDINQKSYWEDVEFYFKRKVAIPPIKHNQNTFKFSKKEMTGIQTTLDRLSIKMEPSELVNYFVKAIQAREKVKFEFTRNLSKAFDLLISLWNKHSWLIS